MHMLDLNRLVEIDPRFKDIPKEGQIEIRNLLYGLAQLALECYVKSKSGSKNPAGAPGLFEPLKEELPLWKPEKHKKE